MIRVGISILYKFFVLELIIYNFFYKKDLDTISIKKKELFNKDLSFLFKYFDSYKLQEGYTDFYHENLKELKGKKLDILEIGVARGYVDISSKQILKNLTNHLNQKFDLIIEDCSHKLIDQILCFSENFKNLKKGGIYIVEDLNFPEIHKMYNPTNEVVDLKTILKKINLGEEIFTKFMKENEIEYIQNNIENIKFYKGHDNSEIVFIKKKVHGTEKEPS